MLDDFTAAGSSSLRIEKLDLDILFKTCTDAKLASLLFDNDISIVALKKFFSTIRDPKFKLPDVTFTDFRSIFEHISLQRRQGAFKRELRLSPFNNPLVLPTANHIPPTALELVVNTMIEDSTPLCIAAMEPYWKDAYAKNGLDFRNMSLVHRSWTSVAQRALRRSVVVPYHRINMFLLSPLCGPWVKEMVIYWTVDDGYRNVTKGDILLLETLFKCAPNVRSLSFNTSLVYPYYDSDSDYEPSLYVDDCLDALSELPSLECLWLKHFHRDVDEIDTYTYSRPVPKLSFYSFPGLHILYTRIPKFQSLELLSIWGWCSSLEQPRLSLNQHPPYRLKAVEIQYTFYAYNGQDEPPPRQYLIEDLVWLLTPRDNYLLESLSFADHQGYITQAVVEALGECLTHLLKLQLCTSGYHRRLPKLLASCKKLESLDIFINKDSRFFYDKFTHSILPSSLKHWGIHFRYYLDPSDRPNADLMIMFLRKLERTFPELPHIQKVLMTAFPEIENGDIALRQIWGMTWDGSFRHMSKAFGEYQKSAIQEFAESFKMKYDVELSCYRNVFPPEWDLILT